MQKTMTTENTHYFIKYNPAINKKFNNRNSSIILDRLEYWFTKVNNGFYKFLEPCSLKMYRVGDSWQEETGLKRKAFKKAFLSIGNWYKSKSEFLKQDRPFQDKLYAAYYDRKQNKMFFLRNHQAVREFFEQLKENSKKTEVKTQEKVGGKQQKPILEKQQESGLTKQQKPASKQQEVGVKQQKVRSWNGLKGRSFVRAHYAHACNKQIYTSSLSSKEEIDYNNIEKLKTIWKQEIGEFKDLNKMAYINKQLSYAFNHCFKADYQRFRMFCRKISSSKFLMGEVTNFKARTDWLLQPKIISAIEDGAYSYGDRQTLYELTQQAVRADSLSLAQDLELTSLVKLSKQIGSSGLIARARLYCIKHFSYPAYKSWFRLSEFVLSANHIAIIGNTEFAKQYINNNFVNQIALEQI